MAPGVDVRVDTQGDAGAGLPFARDAIDALQLSGRLGVDGLHAEIDGLRQLGIRFPDAGKDDLRRNEPGPQGDVDFPPEFASAQAPRLRSRRAMASVELALSA